ncbi:hypothetical protein GCM10009087_28990 [Sphingomonas oligophenolica]|uniref:DUF6491 family protein n=1 Tax=Sphingomonas oligophenolica TaxID=301154 RepID=A0ABU9YBC7_9SPHN
MVRSLLTLSLLMLGAAATAQKAPTPPGTPASIPFVDHDGIYDFEADGDHAVYLQDRSRKWYHATLMGPCLGLSFATRIGVKTSGSSSLDKFGSLLVDRDECKIDELVTSGPPPKKEKKAKRKG